MRSQYRDLASDSTRRREASWSEPFPHRRGPRSSPALRSASTSWANPKVRQALLTAIDRQFILKNVFLGSGQVGKSAFDTRLGWSYNPNGYFISFFPQGYSQTLVEMVNPGSLRISIDKIGRVSRVADQNSVFLAAVEFGDACKEFPIVFVRAGNAGPDNKPAVAPLAVLGLRAGSNLFVQGDKWLGSYVPAYVRRYPFVMARLDDTSNNMAVCYDTQWPAFNETTGEALFKDGEPTEFLMNAKSFLENFEQEAERTRLICELLVDMDLLQGMRFEATLPNGEKIDVEGFLTVNEQKLAELPDAKVVELHRNGMLAVIEMHRISLGNMSRLAAMYQAACARIAFVERELERTLSKPEPAVRPPFEVTSNVSQEAFEQMVRTAKEYIAAGQEVINA